MNLGRTRVPACQLLDADGTRWRVVEVSAEQGRLWVTARLPASDADSDHTDSTLRIFDTTLTHEVQLRWCDPDGKWITVRGVDGDGILWEVRDGDGSLEATRKFPSEDLPTILSKLGGGSVLGNGDPRR